MSRYYFMPGKILGRFCDSQGHSSARNTAWKRLSFGEGWPTKCWICYVTKWAISMKFGMHVEYICPQNLVYGFVD